MADELDFAGLSLEGARVTEFYAYYHVPGGFPMQFADYYLAMSKEDFVYGVKRGSGPEMAWGNRLTYDFEASGRGYRLVLLQLREDAVTLREEARPELWRRFTGTELRQGLLGFSAETVHFLGPVLEALNAV